MERKLAAILAADVVGYSALMERDEAGTFNRLKADRTELFEPGIGRHHGRIFKVMGDGLLAEFGSVVEAVECAAALQRGMAERNVALPDDERIAVRIGINLGEVIVEGEDRYGDGVNVASRLEQLAEAGGIVVSGKVMREVEGKLPLAFESMGEQRVKNIAEPIAAYRVVLGPIGAASRMSGRREGRRPQRHVIAVLALLIAALAVGGWYGFLRPGEVAVPVDGQRIVPTLAVLPFINLSGDPAQDYFGQGVAEDIITALSNFPNLRVMSRTSSFVYDKPVKVQQVRQELGVDYVLEGSVKKADHTVRVTAQLIDAKTGEHVWANRFDEEGANPVAMQADIADRIFASVGGFGGAIAKTEYSTAAAKPGTDLDEYDYYLRGHALWFRNEPGDNAKAREIWQEGLRKFPHSTLLRLKVCITYVNALNRGQSEDPQRDVELGWKLLKEAEADDNRSRLENLVFHWMQAWYYQLHDGNFQKSVAEAEATLELAPYDPLAHVDLGTVLYNAGDTARAVEWVERGVASAPDGPEWYRGTLASAYYHAGRYGEALTTLKKMREPWSYILAATYVRLGKPDEARRALAGTLADCAGCTVKAEKSWPTGKQPQMVDSVLDPYLDDLRKAGLPEG
jgi:adenylate cyclase